MRNSDYEFKNINIDIPDPVQEILDTLIDAGYESYIVGGCVRDCILGRTPKDWDITTQALPYQVKSLFKTTVDSGLEHGTVMVIKKGTGYEVTTFRIDGRYLDGRHPESVEFTPSLKEDLKRRDFTINALAYSKEKGVIDLFGGIKDLGRGLIRCVGDPMARFDEDALRIMRSVRFSAQLGFKIEKKTRRAIRRSAKKLGSVSTERIRAEFEKTLLSDNPSYVNLYKKYGLAPYIFPGAYERCFGKTNALELCRIKEKNAEDLKDLRLAAFFDKLSADEAAKTLKSFTYDNRTKSRVSCIIKFSQAKTEEDRPSVKRMMNKAGADIFILAQKLMIARSKALGTKSDHYERLIKTAQDIISSKEPYRVCDLAVNGKDLMEAGVPSGPEIGSCLEELLEAVIDDPKLNDKEKLTGYLKGSSKR